MYLPEAPFTTIIYCVVSLFTTELSQPQAICRFLGAYEMLLLPEVGKVFLI